MVKRIRKNIVKDRESTSNLFKREISNTRRVVREIISNRRESDKIENIQHFSLRPKSY